MGHAAMLAQIDLLALNDVAPVRPRLDLKRHMPKPRPAVGDDHIPRRGGVRRLRQRTGADAHAERNKSRCRQPLHTPRLAQLSVLCAHVSASAAAITAT